MKVILKELGPKETLLKDMKDGDMAVVLTWKRTVNPIEGAIVQRRYNDLVVLGRSGGDSFSGLFCGDKTPKGYVRMLRPGDVLEII